MDYPGLEKAPSLQSRLIGTRLQRSRREYQTRHKLGPEILGDDVGTYIIGNDR